MTLQEIESAFNEPGFSIMDCCFATGLHPNTLYRIKNGKSERLNRLTKDAVVKYLKSKAK